MATIGPFIQGMGEEVYHLIQTYGPRDTETGWPEITWEIDGCFHPDCFDCDCFDCAEPIKAMIREMGTRVRGTPQGRVVEQRARMYTTEEISVKDRISYQGVVWEVEDVEFSHMLLGDLGYYDCTIIKLEEKPPF